MLSKKASEPLTTIVCQQYSIPRSTLYYWEQRYQSHHTYSNLSRAPLTTYGKVTEAVLVAVLKKQGEYPLLGSWRLSLFEYEGVSLSDTTIWQILTEARSPLLPRQILYILTHPFQIWFVDHPDRSGLRGMHLRTLKNGQKVYSLIVLDGWSRVLVSDEIVLSKGARDACVILLKAFAKWGMPEQILSDNAKAFTSLLYRLLLGVLRVKVRYITPGCPWENPFAESFIGTLRAYFYPHMQRQQSVAGAQGVYTEKTDYYNHRVHWAFRKDEVKTPLGKLGKAFGRPLPKDFELGVVATGKRFARTVDGQGRISIKRYRLFVSVDLSKQRVEIREFFDSLVVTYRSGTVVSYPCFHEQSKIAEIANAPIFHDHPGIEVSRQLELFDISEFLLRYVSRRPENQKRKRIEIDAIQLTFL